MKKRILLLVCIFLLVMTLPLQVLADAGASTTPEEGDIHIPPGGSTTPPAGTYTVTFKNDDGTVISSEKYNLGDTVVIPEAPTKDADYIGSYTFAGWDKEVIAVIGNATYTATYTTTYKEYTIRFQDEDGTVLDTLTLHWGDAVTAPADPTKADDDTYTYAFAGWSPVIVPVVGNAIYTATYSKSEIPVQPPLNGWQQEGGIWYFYDNGVKLTNSWMNDSTGGWCYLTDTGAMATDTFVQDTKGWAYVDGRGYWKQGTYWQLVDGTWYYLENGYQVRNAWKKDTKGWCWLTETGAMATNTFVKDSKGWAYVDNSGYWDQSTRWLWLDTAWYYLEGGYNIRNAWRRDSIGWCWLTETGAMATNTFVKDSKGWAYVDGSGYWKTSTGWIQLDGKWYYLEGGYQVRAQWRKDSKGWCYLTEEGYMLTNSWLKDSVGWCYIDEYGYCLANGTYTVEGHEYTFDADGRIEGEPIR